MAGLRRRVQESAWEQPPLLHEALQTATPRGPERPVHPPRASPASAQGPLPPHRPCTGPGAHRGLSQSVDTGPSPQPHYPHAHTHTHMHTRGAVGPSTSGSRSADLDPSVGPQEVPHLQKEAVSAYKSTKLEHSLSPCTHKKIQNDFKI